jgi:hypothetical protein
MGSKIDVFSLSRETTAKGIFPDHFNRSQESVDEAIKNGNREFFASIYRKRIEQIDTVWLMGTYPHLLPRLTMYEEIIKSGKNETAEVFGIAGGSGDAFQIEDWWRAEVRVPTEHLKEYRAKFFEKRAGSPTF